MIKNSPVTAVKLGVESFVGNEENKKSSLLVSLLNLKFTVYSWTPDPGLDTKKTSSIRASFQYFRELKVLN